MADEKQPSHKAARNYKLRIYESPISALVPNKSPSRIASRYVPPKNFSRPNATSKGSTGKEGKPAENNHLSSSFPSKRIHRVVDTQSEFEGIFLVGFTEEEKKKEEERKIFGRWFYVPGRWWSGWVASEKRGCGSRASTHIIFFLSRFAKSQPCVTHQLQSSNYELQGFASW